MRKVRGSGRRGEGKLMKSQRMPEKPKRKWSDFVKECVGQWKFSRYILIVQ